MEQKEEKKQQGNETSGKDAETSDNDDEYDGMVCGFDMAMGVLGRVLKDATWEKELNEYFRGNGDATNDAVIAHIDKASPDLIYKTLFNYWNKIQVLEQENQDLKQAKQGTDV